MDLASTIQRLVILIPPILFAVTIHEVAHGWVADKLGDPTARAMGRLTLNPIKHLDPVGTLVFFLTQTIGWARPVPVNPLNFKNPKRDMIWVSVAGPASNVAVAALCAIFVKHGVRPLSVFLPDLVLTPLVLMLIISVQLNIGLAIFNLIPIPPLDGSKVLAGLLPARLFSMYHEFERWGFILLLLLVFTGVTGRIIVPLIFWLYSLFMRI